MMKKLYRLMLGFLCVSLFVIAANTSLAHGQDRGESKAKIGEANVSIEYGRPSLQGRDPLKMLQPGSVWRMGANEATTITSDADLDFGGKKVAQGKHILLARLAESGKWSLIVSTKSAFQYEPSAKLAEVPLEFREAEESIEDLTITLSEETGKGMVEIAWGKARLTGSFVAAK